MGSGVCAGPRGLCTPAQRERGAGASGPAQGATRRCPVQEGLLAEKAEVAAGRRVDPAHSEASPRFWNSCVECFKVLSKAM